MPEIVVGLLIQPLKENSADAYLSLMRDEVSSQVLPTPSYRRHIFARLALGKIPPHMVGTPCNANIAPLLNTGTAGAEVQFCAKYEMVYLCYKNSPFREMLGSPPGKLSGDADSGQHAK